MKASIWNGRDLAEGHAKVSAISSDSRAVMVELKSMRDPQKDKLDGGQITDSVLLKMCKFLGA